MNMWKRVSAFFLLLIVWCAALPVIAQDSRELVQEDDRTQKRTALVIGNANYMSARKLSNSANDATDMTKTLTGLGFEVISGTDLNLQQMAEKVREFGDKLRVNGGVGLFYYAGHGVQVSGRNFLIPVDANIPREDEVAFNTLQLDLVLQKMATANNGLNIVILDACRNNPFARSWSRSADAGGLAQVTAPTGTFIAYATSPDKTASDGTGRNGLYTSELLKYLKQPGLKIEETFKQVTIAVDRTSGGKQVPWTSSSLRGEFYFARARKPDVTAADPLPTDEPKIVAKSKVEQERESWDLVKNSNNSAIFRLFLEEFPDGANSGKAKIRLEELVWLSVKNSNDKTQIQSFLDEFPSGVNVAAARIRLRQLAVAEKNVITLPNVDGTTANRTAGEISKATLPGNVEMSFAYIPAGEFRMGSKNHKNEKPVHTVKISQGFWMQTTEVTQSQWQALLGINPSKFKNCLSCPVEMVSWEDARQFISKLNAQNDGYKYRLPTEAEWEYAARAGTTGDYAGSLDSMAWYSANSGGKTHEVGTKSPNSWGLYDMHGNVYEWVEDRYDSRYYTESPVTDPTGSASGSTRVFRGGSWGNPAEFLRSAFRHGDSPAIRGNNLGVRVVRQ